MNGHPTGCQCAGCLAEQQKPYLPNGPFVAYAVTFPAPTVTLYACPTPSEPFISWPPPSTTITFTPTPESLELQEIRALRRDFNAMAKLVDRFLGKGKGKAKK